MLFAWCSKIILKESSKNQIEHEPCKENVYIILLLVQEYQNGKIFNYSVHMKQRHEYHLLGPEIEMKVNDPCSF